MSPMDIFTPEAIAELREKMAVPGEVSCADCGKVLPATTAEYVATVILEQKKVLAFCPACAAKVKTDN